jgi:ABC-type transport system involved in multi-copper enzyme maturation permease subunit
MSRLNGLRAPMVNAEFLKLRTRRGLVAMSAALTVGVIVVAYGVTLILHAANPAQYGPAGGAANLWGIMGALALLGSVAAILIGATAGAQDVQSGVFRDLAATGRSRVALFAARIPGGLLLLWPLVVMAWVMAGAASIAFAGGLATPDLEQLVAGGAWVLTAITANYLLALGIAAMSGSRTTAVGVVLAWQFVVSQLLVGIAVLGSARRLIELAALTRLIPPSLGTASDPVSASMSFGMAALVVVAWSVVALALGAWRTVRLDA